MLRPRWRKVLRDLWLHKSRTMLVVMAISIGIIGAGSVLDAWSLLRRATRVEFSASNPASATLRTDSIDATLMTQVRAMPEIASAQARRTVVASARTETGWHTAMLFASDDLASHRIGVIKPDRGLWPPTDGTLVIEHSSVEYARVTVGDSLTMQIGDSAPRTLPIAGIARDVGLAPGWMEHVVYIFVTPATLARLGAPSTLNELQIVVREHGGDRDAIRRVAGQVKTLVEATGRRVTDVNVPVPGRHIHAAQIDSLLYTQGAFGLLALLLSGFLVVNLIAAMLTGQVREIGVMKAIGARAGQIAAMYLGLALIVGLLASAVAVPLAVLLGRAYANFTAGILNFDIAGFTIPWWVIASQIAVGTLLPVIAAAFPVTRGCRISVSEALRDFGVVSRGDNAAGRLLQGAGWITRPMLLSLRNAFRRRQRMALTLLTLATGGAVYLGAINLRASIVGSVDLLFSAQKYDMVMAMSRSYPADSLVAAVRGVTGVTGAEAWSSGRGSVRSAEGPMGNAFPIIAPPFDTRMFVPRMERGRWVASGSANELVVNRSLLADEPALELGKEVTLMMAGKAARWTVVGVADAGLSPSAYAARQTVARVVGNGEASAVVIASEARGMGTQLDLIQRVRATLTQQGFDVRTGHLMAQQRRVVEDHLLMVAGFLGSMSLLMIVVGGLGLASTMSLAVLERTREIGVLRAIGAPHRAILGMVQIEGLVIAVLSWLIALPLSVPMSVALERAFGRIIMAVPVTLVPEPSGVLRWFVVVVVVSLVACAWPAFRATRITTAAALAYE